MKAAVNSSESPAVQAANELRTMTREPPEKLKPLETRPNKCDSSRARDQGDNSAAEAGGPAA